MVDSRRVMEQAEATLRRISPENRTRAAKARERRRRAAVRVGKRLFLAAVAIVGAAIAVGLIFPIGVEGFALAMLALFIAWGAILWFSATPEATPQTLAASDLPLLPQQTEAWLERQRPALPAPAARLVDGIGVRLEALAPQLATLDPREPAALEIRKLMAEELPELVSGYQRVPQALRRTPDAVGVTPDQQLADGLTLVDSELARMTAQLASGDLHKLATQRRYLELKYKGDE